MKHRFLIMAAMAFLPAAGSASEVKIGNVGGITGPIAELIAPIIEGRRVAVAQINAQGGLLDGRNYRLVTADSACDPKAAVDAGLKVVNVDQVAAILGPSCSGATLALAQSVAIPAGVVVLSESATAPSISELDDKDLVFRGTVSDTFQGKALAHLVRDRGYENVAVTYANDDYNAAMAEVFLSAFAEIGGNVTAELAHESDRASYRSEVATLSSSGGDALVIFAYYGNSGSTIIKNALETDAFGYFIGADGMVSEELIASIGASNLADKSMFTTSSADNSTPAYKLYQEAMEAAGQTPEGPYVANGYDIAFLMGLAVEVAGTDDRAAIGPALRKVASAPGEIILPGQWAKAKALIAEGKDIDYQGATGNFDFDAKGDIGGIFAVNTVADSGAWEKEILR